MKKQIIENTKAQFKFGSKLFALRSFCNQKQQQKTTKLPLASDDLTLTCAKKLPFAFVTFSFTF